MFFQKTPPFEGWYIYLGRNVFLKTSQKGGYVYLGWYVIGTLPSSDTSWNGVPDLPHSFSANNCGQTV